MVLASGCALDWTAAVGICWLSIVEHQKSLRPSTPLTLYLLILILDDAYALLTAGATGLRCSKAVLSACLFMLECQSKSSTVRSQYRHFSPETLAGLVDRAFFDWIKPMLSTTSPFVVPPIDEAFSSNILAAQAIQDWSRTSVSSERFSDRTTNQFPSAREKHALLQSLFRVLCSPFLAAVPLRLGLIGFRYAQPPLMAITVDFLHHSHAQHSDYSSAVITLAALLIYTGLAVCNSIYRHQIDRLAVLTRGCLIGLLHQKTLHIHNAFTKPEDGRVMALLSNDVEALIPIAEIAHDTWAYLLEVVVGMVLLSQRIGWLSVMLLVGIFGTEASRPSSVLSFVDSFPACSRVSRYVARHLHPRQKRWNQATQQRLAATGSALSALKSVKMAGATSLLRRNVCQLRQHELSEAAALRWVQVFYNASGLLSIPRPSCPFS